MGLFSNIINQKEVSKMSNKEYLENQIRKEKKDIKQLKKDLDITGNLELIERIEQEITDKQANIMKYENELKTKEIENFTTEYSWYDY